MANTPPPPPPPKRSRAKAQPSTPVEPSQPSQPSQDDVAPKAPRARKAPLQAKLEEFFAMPCLVYGFVGDDYGAQLVAARAPLVAEAWYDLSKQNAAVKRILERLTEGGAWGAVIFSSASLLIPLAQHHGAIPGTDPFLALGLPGPTPGAASGPIVPPPPAPDGSPQTASAGPENAGAGNGHPPGAVTVAGLRAMGADRSVTHD